MPERASEPREDGPRCAPARPPTPAPRRGAREEEGGRGTSSRGVRPPYPVRDQDLAARTLPHLSLSRSGGGGLPDGQGCEATRPCDPCVRGLGFWREPPGDARSRLPPPPAAHARAPPPLAHVGWGVSPRGGGAISGLVATWGRGQGSCWVGLLGGV